jgi:hypothetical protein
MGNKREKKLFLAKKMQIRFGDKKKSYTFASQLRKTTAP